MNIQNGLTIKEEVSQLTIKTLNAKGEIECESCELLIETATLNEVICDSDIQITNYTDENFYKEHKTFKFATLNEVSEYKVIAVFMSKIYYKHQNVFKFYFFKDAQNEQEFNNYINNIKKLSMYPIEDTATYGEQLITLTTCDYYTENGRFVVVAKKVNSYINE